MLGVIGCELRLLRLGGDENRFFGMEALGFRVQPRVLGRQVAHVLLDGRVLRVECEPHLLVERRHVVHTFEEELVAAREVVQVHLEVGSVLVDLGIEVVARLLLAPLHLVLVRAVVDEPRQRPEQLRPVVRHDVVAQRVLGQLEGVAELLEDARQLVVERRGHLEARPEDALQQESHHEDELAHARARLQRRWRDLFVVAVLDKILDELVLRTVLPALGFELPRILLHAARAGRRALSGACRARPPAQPRRAWQARPPEQVGAAGHAHPALDGRQ